MRRRIRPVPTPSSSHERRTGARRHAAGSWNGRCGAPRTNAHSPPLCAAAPLRGVTRASSGAIGNVPARTPRAAGRPLRLTRVVWQGGSVRHLYSPADPARASALRKATPRGFFFFVCAFDQKALTSFRAVSLTARPRRAIPPFPSRIRLPVGPLVRAGETALVVYGALVRAGVPCCCLR